MDQPAISKFFKQQAANSQAASAAASSAPSSGSRSTGKAKSAGRGKVRAPKPLLATQISKPQWSCGACTLVNQGAKTACEVCGTPRDEGGSSSQPSKIQSSQAQLSDIELSRGQLLKAAGKRPFLAGNVDIVEVEDGDGGSGSDAGGDRLQAPLRKRQAVTSSFGLETDNSSDRAQRLASVLAGTDTAGNVPAAATASGASKGGGGNKIIYTPMEQQILDLKHKHRDVLLLVECGYRFRFFGDDAEIAAQVLRVYSHLDHNFKVASVPTHRLAVHVRRLVDAGHKVGVVRQTESAALKAAGLGSGPKSKMFRRELVATFTPATFIESAVEALVPPGIGNGNGSANGGGCVGEGFDAADEAAAAGGEIQEPRQEHWLAAVYEELAGGGGADSGDAVRIGFVAVDVRAGVVVFDDFVDAMQQRGQLETRLRHLRPLEFLLPAAPGLSRHTERVLRQYRDAAVDYGGHPRVVRAERLPREEFSFGRASACLAEHGREDLEAVTADAGGSGSGGDSGGGIDNDGGGIGAGGGGGGSSFGYGKGLTLSLLELPRRCVCAMGALLAHLKRFGMGRALSRPQLKPFQSAACMTLDAVTLRDLEVLQADGKEAGSLLWLLNHTSTSAGYRTLREWVTKPLLQREAILERQDAIELLATDPPLALENLVASLRPRGGGAGRGGCGGWGGDLEPLIASLHHRSVNPKRLHKLLRFAVKAAKAMPSSAEAAAVAAPLLRHLLQGVPAGIGAAVEQFLGQMDAAAALCDDTTGALRKEVGAEVHPPLGRAVAAVAAAESSLQEELRAVRKLLRRPALQYRTLRTGVSSQLEYLIELRKAEARDIPSDWVMVSQTKDLVRYHTARVLRLQQTLLVAREEHAIAAKEAWRAFVALADEACHDGLRRLVASRGEVDALLALARVAQLPGYVRPNICRISGGSGTPAGNGCVSGGATGQEQEQALEERIIIYGGRHPAVEQMMAGKGCDDGGGTSAFVPNDVDLAINFGRRGCLCISGPNMGGKSSYVRMIALLQVLGQIGSWVPADWAQCCVLDGIYTRMGAGDDLAAGMSTFMLELWHASAILRRATPRSLVVFDELGRGTSTHDGVAVAMSTLRYMIESMGCAVLMTTHYPEVAALAEDPSPALRRRIVNVHMAFLEAEASGADGDVVSGRHHNSDGAGGDSSCAGDGSMSGTGGSSGGDDHGIMSIVSSVSVNHDSANGKYGSSIPDGAKDGGAGDEEGDEGAAAIAAAAAVPAITFLYRAVDGMARKSYGLHTARVAGLDADVLCLAAQKASEMRQMCISDGSGGNDSGGGGNGGEELRAMAAALSRAAAAGQVADREVTAALAAAAAPPAAALLKQLRTTQRAIADSYT